MNIKVVRVSLLMASLFVAYGCDSPTMPPPPPPPPPPPVPVTSVISEGSTSNLPRNFYVPIGIQTFAPGDLEAIVDWTLASDRLWMYLAEGECREQFAESECPFDPSCECQFLVRSESDLPKPRSLSAPDRAPGFHTLVVWNHGPETESISWQVLLTTLTGTSGAGSRLRVVESESSRVSPLWKAPR